MQKTTMNEKDKTTKDDPLSLLSLHNSKFIKKFFDESERGAKIDIALLVRKVLKVNCDVDDDLGQRKEQQKQRLLIQTHLWRANVFTRIAKLYTTNVWNCQGNPRKFFLKYRGFGISDNESNLISYFRNYLTIGLSSCQRAIDMLINRRKEEEEEGNNYEKYYYNCIKLKCTILCSLCACSLYDEKKKCQECLECLLLLQTLEEQNNDNNNNDKESMNHTKKMIIHISHAVAEKNGSWDNLFQMQLNEAMIGYDAEEQVEEPFSTTYFENLQGFNYDEEALIEGIMQSCKIG